MNPSNKEKVEQFISIVEKVKNARFTRETKKVGYQLNFEAGQPLKQETTGFDEEDLRSMLLDLRKFTLKKDGVYLPDICDLLIANTTDQKIINNLQKCKDIYASLMKEPTIKMIINSKSETGEDVIKKWLYGYYFHEKQHAKDLDNLGVGQTLHKTNFVIAITNLITLSAYVANNGKLVI